mmetsp:Transcript_47448/g.125597  ORF Transcript_47448/g.125597 Transcript_47448/m.125597 type:complete len:316 (+) Transcript_47448:43-990(+)
MQGWGDLTKAAGPLLQQAAGAAAGAALQAHQESQNTPTEGTEAPAGFMGMLAPMATAAAAAASTTVQTKVSDAFAGQDPATAALLDQLGVQKVIDGIKEALCVGIDKAVEIVGQTNGYMGNPGLKIMVPPELAVVAKTLREKGLGQLVDKFEESMNRAAENAAPQALGIVKNGIRNMDIDDVKRVWKGGDDAATRFLQHKCNDDLKLVMREECERVLDSNKVTQYYSQIIDHIKDVPVVGELAEKYDIRNHTLQKALDGLYIKMAEQEKLIRDDPAHRTTELLTQVFGFKQPEAAEPAAEAVAEAAPAPEVPAAA